jgi:hypothetical protein
MKPSFTEQTHGTANFLSVHGRGAFGCWLSVLHDPLEPVISLVQNGRCNDVLRSFYDFISVQRLHLIFVLGLGMSEIIWNFGIRPFNSTIFF